MRKRLLTFLCLLLVGGGISVYAQKDVTSQYITNATLSSLDGWTNVNFNTPVKGNNTTGYASECYAGWGSLEKTNYSLTQTITLPAGRYTLVNYSFFRYGVNYDTDASKSLAFLKAGDSEVAIKTLGSITATTYANSQAEGANAFDSKMYRNTLDFTISTDNTPIEIGIYGTFDIKQSWMIAGMFELIDNDTEATMDAPFDVTGYMTNPGFEYRDITGWTVSPNGYFQAQGNNQSFKVGGHYAEKWQGSGALPEGSMSQTLTNLPAGYYKLTANLGGNGTYIKLNSKTTSWTADGNYTTGYVLGENEPLTITAGKTAEGTANWIHFDNFKLHFCGDVAAALTTLINKLSYYESILPSALYSSLATNVNAYNKTYSDVDELLAAIAAVQQLYDGVDPLANAIATAQDLIDNTQAKVASAYKTALQTAINNAKSLTSTDQIDSAVTAINAAINDFNTSVSAYAIIASGTVSTSSLNGWTCTNTNLVEGTKFHINTWSTEGNSDGSNMRTPFIENWVGQGSFLGAGTFSYTLDHLEPGEAYYAEALIRSYNEASADAPNGPNFFINDVEVDLPTAGTTFTYNNMSGIYATLGGIATVDAGGKLTLGAKIASNANYNWVAFKNVSIRLFADVLADVVAEAEALYNNLYSSEVKAQLKSVIDANRNGTDGSAIQNIRNAMAAAKLAVRVPFKGVYYVQNAANGKFMSAGHNWGTRGIVDEVGLDLTLTPNETTRLVTFDSQVAKNATDHFLSNYMYMDGAAYSWRIEQTGDDTYSISDGTKYIGVDDNDELVLVDDAVEWKFITKDDRIAALHNANANNGMDATFLLKDHNLSRNNQRNNAWTLEPKDMETWRYKRSDGEDGNGSVGNNCAEVYHSAFTFSQTVSGAPVGYYELHAQGFYREDGEASDAAPVFFLTSNGQEDVLDVSKKTGEENSLTEAAVSFRAGKYDHTLPWSAVIGNFTVGVRGTAANQWVSFDNFRLTYYGPVPAEKSQMDPALTVAKDLVADANKTEGKEALSEALTTAQTVYSNISSYNYDEFGAEAQKLEAAIKTFRLLYAVPFNGAYYVQNAESGKYMSAGHDWGTRGIVDQVGLDLTLAANKDKTVKFDSQVNNGGANNFLNNSLYMDGAAYGWYIEKAGDDTYTISDGVYYVGTYDNDELMLGSQPVAWKFISMADRKAALNAATKDNGMDATFLIKDHNFGRNNQRNSAWKVSEDCPASNRNLSGGEIPYGQEGAGTVGNNCAEAYHTTFTISQAIADAPAGYYVLEAQGFYRQDGGTEDAPVFFINEVTKPVSVSAEYTKVGEGTMTSACGLFTEGKYNTVTDMCTATESLTVGIKGTGKSQWVCFDNFRLTYYGPNPAETGQMDPALAIARELAADALKTEGKAALNAAIAAAETSYNNIGSYTYNEFKVEVKKLEAAIEAFRKANRIAMKGVYYVQNVASGKFMSAGKNWGTQAIVDQVGLDLTLAANDDNRVSFDSQVSNGGDNHFLNNGLYTDGAAFNWNIEKMSDNTFSIGDGTKFIGVDDNDNLVLADEAVAWRFVTEADRIAALEDATEDDPMDATFLIKDYNFNRNDQRTSLWTVSDDCSNVTMGGPADKNLSNYCTESWHSTFTISQTISGAPAGIYGLKAQGFYRQDPNGEEEISEDVPVFFINTETLPVPTRTGSEGNLEGAAASFAAGTYDMEEPIMYSVVDGTITVGIKGTAKYQWVAFDNFRLTYYGLSGEDITNPPVVKKDLVFTGEPQVLIEAGSHETGTVQYSTDKVNFTTELPTGTDAGTYNVWYRAVDEDGVPLLATKKITIRIASAKISDFVSAKLSETQFTYDGTAKEPAVTVTGNLTEGTDYTVTYEDNTHAGTGRAVITGQGNYGNMISLPFNIAKLQLTSFVMTDSVLVYSEEEQIARIDSVMAGEMMVPADEYTISGNVEKEVGTYTLTVTANEDGNFDGELTAEFNIVGSPIDVCDMKLNNYKFVYNGKENEPAVTVTRGERTLKNGVDYKVSYQDNVGAGTAKAIITGIGNYAGTKVTTFKITQGVGNIEMLNKEVTMPYNAGSLTVKPMVILGDGPLRYTSSNDSVARAIFYSGEIFINNVGQTTITVIMSSTKNVTADTTSFVLTVVPASATLVNITRQSMGYGIPTFKVSSNVETLVEGKDYTLSYRDLQGHAVTEEEMLAAPGRYVVVANLKGNYEGTQELEFKLTVDPMTGIGAVTGDDDGTVRYDMNGRRVQKTHRGMVIENGKKVVIK